eukprot:TRINITY_DN1414_c0_g2_i1.p1 TRINITY_DN1414_c0_g2~~TRINITY_DN1414_c0_g2_i1.p1  ORF type:complete len:317 (+),score=60.39 TRINITY_DN1414_c0_g2_i1:110-1060(+)
MMESTNVRQASAAGAVAASAEARRQGLAQRLRALNIRLTPQDFPVLNQASDATRQAIRPMVEGLCALNCWSLYAVALERTAGIAHGDDETMRAEAKELIVECLRFLILQAVRIKGANGAMFIPLWQSPQIDRIWNLLIQFHDEYDAISLALLPGYRLCYISLADEQTKPGAIVRNCFYVSALKEYRKTFGAPPARLWPEPIHVCVINWIGSDRDFYVLPTAPPSEVRQAIVDECNVNPEHITLHLGYDGPELSPDAAVGSLELEDRYGAQYVLIHAELTAEGLAEEEERKKSSDERDEDDEAENSEDEESSGDDNK